jgi:hypothetical protein
MQSYQRKQGEAEGRLVQLETKIEVFWKTIIARASDMIQKDDK